MRKSPSGALIPHLYRTLVIISRFFQILRGFIFSLVEVAQFIKGIAVALCFGRLLKKLPGPLFIGLASLAFHVQKRQLRI